MEYSPGLVTDTGIQTTTLDATSPEAIKASVDAEYDDKPHGGSKTPWIMIGVTIVLIIIFGIALLVFFLLGNKP